MTGSTVRAHNEAVVLGLLRSHRRMSRAELARETGLSLPTTMDIVDRLHDEGFVRLLGTAPTAGGRPPKLYEFAPAARTAIGISIGTSTTSAVLTDLDGTVVHELEEPSRLHEGNGACLRQISAMADELLAQSTRHPVLGIGIGIAALILDSEGRALKAGTGEEPVLLHEVLAEKYRLPVELDNYAKAVAVGEHRHGAGRGYRNMLCVVLQEGVGAGVIIDGALHRGGDGAAGRFGATIVPGPAGSSTLDEIAGSTGIERIAAERFTGNPTAQEVFDAARSGDEPALEVLHDVATALAEAVHNAATLLDPELVVLTGSTLTAAGELLVAPVRAQFERPLGPRLTTGALGERAGAVGAAALLLRNVLIDPPRP